MMTWSGTKTIENRSRPQNYLLDLNTDIHYLYADSDLLLSNNGIAWIDLKKPDNEIAKGQPVSYTHLDVYKRQLMSTAYSDY